MRLRIAPGELVLALFFVLLGGLWIVAALRMPLWQGFVPQSGFMPLWYGVALVGLSAAIVVNLYLGRMPAPAEEPLGKALVVVALIAATILGFGLIGYALSTFLLLLVLFAAVERLSLARSLVVATAITAVLFGVFRLWLGVPLPVGPLGI